MQHSSIDSFAAARPLPIPASEPVLTLFDTLGPGHADGHALAREIWRLEAEGCPRVHLRINSAGGSVAQGYSLFSALRHTRMEVHTWADGLALSMAGLVFLAGRCRHMAPWSMLMLHNPSLTAEGERDEPGNALILERIRTSVLKMYEGCTALDGGRLSAMMEAETWLTASEALALGLATDLAGQEAAPDLETALRARAAAGSSALEEAVMQVRPVQDEERPATEPAPARTVLEASLIGHLELIEAQLAALHRRLQVPVEAAAASLPGYAPLPGKGGDAAGELSFREMERRDPQALARLEREQPVRFKALFEASYGRKGGAQ